MVKTLGWVIAWGINLNVPTVFHFEAGVGWDHQAKPKENFMGVVQREPNQTNQQFCTNSHEPKPLDFTQQQRLILDPPHQLEPKFPKPQVCQSPAQSGRWAKA